MNAPSPPDRPGTELLLMGGSARAAYQVGVLQGIAALHRRLRPGARAAPFDIIAGTSAGAINAAALACQADRFHIPPWRNWRTSGATSRPRMCTAPTPCTRSAPACAGWA